MNYAEQKADQIRAYMQAMYLKLLESKGIASVVGSTSYSCYRLLLKDLMTELLKEIRQSFRENHFIDMQEGIFNKYMSDKFDFFRSTATELINQLYFYEADIAREELYSYNMDNIQKIREYFYDVYIQAREISLEYRKKQKELDEKLEKLLEKYL
jgi:hypothetical protein